MTHSNHHLTKSFFRFWVGIVALFFMGHGVFAATLKQNDPSKQTSRTVFFNEDVITGLYDKTQMEQTDQIFDLVFSSLKDTVTVYPTENYYYFSLNTAGKTLWGNLRLDVIDRDQGIIHLGD